MSENTRPASSEADINELREQSLAMSFEFLQADVTVAHRIGFWHSIDWDQNPVSEAEIAYADEELERYVQLRIARSQAGTLLQDGGSQHD